MLVNWRVCIWEFSQGFFFVSHILRIVVLGEPSFWQATVRLFAPVIIMIIQTVSATAMVILFIVFRLPMPDVCTDQLTRCPALSITAVLQRTSLPPGSPDFCRRRWGSQSQERIVKEIDWTRFEQGENTEMF